MRRMLQIISLTMAIAMLLSMSALAADNGSSDVFNLKVIRNLYDNTKMVALSSEGEVNFTTEYVNNEKIVASSVFKNIIKFTLTFDSNFADDDYVVFLLKDGDKPTANNISYINQNSASETQSFTIYPNKLEAGSKYGVYLSSKNDPYKMIASFEVASVTVPADYLLGDADGNGKVNSSDALWILKYVAQILGEDVVVKDTQLSSAEVNFDTKINSTDALRILQLVAQLIPGFYSEV